jgi:hypothetical protein
LSVAYDIKTQRLPLSDFGGVDDPLGDLRHVLLPSRAGFLA